jgi:hypothetical protein
MEWSVEHNIHFFCSRVLYFNHIRWSGQLKIIFNFSAREFVTLNNQIRWSSQLNIISTYSALEFGILIKMEWSLEDHIQFLNNQIRWSGQSNKKTFFSGLELGILVT